jgi:hypothetical protein
VSWLFVALIPGLLMLATFGLERLEAGLVDDTLTASDVAEFLEQAEPVDVSRLAREGMPEALDCLHRRRTERANDELTTRPGRAEPAPDALLTAAYVSGAEEPRSSMPRHRHSRANRQFEPPRHADRV